MKFRQVIGEDDSKGDKEKKGGVKGRVRVMQTQEKKKKMTER